MSARHFADQLRVFRDAPWRRVQPCRHTCWFGAIHLVVADRVAVSASDWDPRLSSNGNEDVTPLADGNNAAYLYKRNEPRQSYAYQCRHQSVIAIPFSSQADYH